MAQYNFLQRWSAAYQTGEELPVDLFARKLFGEVLARSYGPTKTPSDIVADFSRLQHAARGFVELGPEVSTGGSPAIGARFLEMLSMRVTPARADDDPSPAPGVVDLMPVHTFLTGDLTCDYQFWLDAGSQTWWEPPARPLANSRVLLPDWPADQPWDARAKSSTQSTALARVVLGLASRARHWRDDCWLRGRWQYLRGVVEGSNQDHRSSIHRDACAMTTLIALSIEIIRESDIHCHPNGHWYESMSRTPIRDAPSNQPRCRLSTGESCRVVDRCSIAE